VTPFGQKHVIHKLNALSSFWGPLQGKLEESTVLNNSAAQLNSSLYSPVLGAKRIHKNPMIEEMKNERMTDATMRTASKSRPGICRLFLISTTAGAFRCE
jgi:hypothetical protein